MSLLMTSIWVFPTLHIRDVGTGCDGKAALGIFRNLEHQIIRNVLVIGLPDRHMHVQLRIVHMDAVILNIVLFLGGLIVGFMLAAICSACSRTRSNNEAYEQGFEAGVKH